MNATFEELKPNRAILNHTVTIIIPVLNAASLLKKVLEALAVQTYPQELIEIIVVDNGSQDNSPDTAKSFDVNLLYETEKKSPYAARNVGFKQATGSIIALTDANKIPDKQWIEEGVASLLDKQADLAGGQILFDLEENSTSAEIYDAATYNDNRTFVLENNSSAAGNLFFRREVMEKTGPFPDQFRSGMDIWWTKNAVQKGFKIAYAEKAIVRCKPRKLSALLKKSFRVGVLHPVIFQQMGESFPYILGQTFRTFAPPKTELLKQKLKELNRAESMFSVWCVAWMCKIMMGFGRMLGLTNLDKEFSQK